MSEWGGGGAATRPVVPQLYGPLRPETPRLGAPEDRDSRGPTLRESPV